MFTVPADLMGCRLVSASVFVGKCPIKGGNVNAAAGFAHQIEPRLVDGGVGGAGIKHQSLRDALQQNNPDREKE